MPSRNSKDLSIEQMAEEWGVDLENVRIKFKLVKVIQRHCKRKKISQRKLAAMVPGLTQDRVWRILSGQVGHMTIDKLVMILSAIGYTVTVKARAA